MQVAKCVQSGIRSPKHSVRSASSWNKPAHSPLRVPFSQRRSTNPTSDQLQFRDRLCIRSRTGHQPIVPSFRFEIYRLVELHFRNCLNCFWSNQLLCFYLHWW